MSNLVDKLKSNDYIVSSDLMEYILEKGVENVRFIVPMKRKGTITPLGIMISSNDPDYPTECKITENQYLVKDNYKISLTPAGYDGYIENYYLSDLASLIQSKHIRLNEPELIYEPSMMESFGYNIDFNILMNVCNSLNITLN